MSAFKDENSQHPNYGKAMSLNPSDWWSNVCMPCAACRNTHRQQVIVKTFAPFVNGSEQVPSELVSTLITRFSSAGAYELYSDVLPLFETLANLKSQKRNRSDETNSWGWDMVVTGVVTNSDDRVLQVLKSLELKVRDRRYSISGADQGYYDKRKTESFDIDFSVFSYDVGHAKPDRKIFDAASGMLGCHLSDDIGLTRGNDKPAGLGDFEKLFVGDDYQKDVIGAEKAGWHAVYLDRTLQEDHPDSRSKPITIDAQNIFTSDQGKQVQIISNLDALRRWSPGIL